jgi:hypothetical protein
MANSLINLLVKLGLDATAFTKGLDDAIDKSDGASKRMVSGLSTIGGAAVLGGFAAVGAGAVAMGAFLKDAIPAASDLNETVSKVGIVFGGSADEVLAYGENAAAALGMSKNEALSATGVYGNLFRAMGMGEDVSADMSMGLVTLAGDLASFNNMDPTEVLDKLRAGLSGETEPLKSLGVNLNQAAVEAKALSMGLGTTTVDLLDVAEAENKYALAAKESTQAARKYGAESLEAQKAAIAEAKAQEALEKALAGGKTELNAAEKAQATYALVMEQTTLAQGDFERTSDGLANQQRIAAAQWKDLQAVVGKAFLPTVVKLVSFFTKNMPKIIQAVQPLVEKIPAMLDGLLLAFQTGFGWLMDNQGVIVGVLAAIGVAIATFVYTTVIPALIAFAVASWPVIAVMAAVAAAGYLLYTAWTENWGGIQQIMAGVWASVQPVLQMLWDWLQVNIPKALAWLANVWQTVLLPAIMNVWKWVQDTVFPLAAQLFAWLQVNIPLALQTLSTFWTTVLWPAIQAVWGWMNTVLFPLFRSLGNFLGAVFGLTLTVLAGIWQNVLWPAIQSVYALLLEKLTPVFQALGDWMTGTFFPIVEKAATWIGVTLVKAFDGLNRIIADVMNWLDDMATKLSNLHLPDWMTPGSPTPWEMGLKGVSAALSELTNTRLPNFQARLDFGNTDVPVGVAAALSDDDGKDAGASTRDSHDTYNIFAKETPGEISHGLTLAQLTGGAS